MPNFHWTDFTRSRQDATVGGCVRNGGGPALKTASGNKANPVRVAKFKAQLANDPGSEVGYENFQERVAKPEYISWLNWALGVK